MRMSSLNSTRLNSISWQPISVTNACEVWHQRIRDSRRSPALLQVVIEMLTTPPNSTGIEVTDRVRERLNAALKGKQDVVEMVLVCLLSKGHLLLEDKPGLGKTTLAKALAMAIGGEFARAECTPDLLPSDMT